MKHDIQDRDDLYRLMDEFYKKLLADPSISYLFTDEAKINILTHLPVLVDFWETVLLHEGQGAMRTPVQFGGGKDKAKPIFEKALTLYKTFKPVNNLYPKWGQSETEKLLAECNEKDND